jgi:hypothetical protein
MFSKTVPIFANLQTHRDIGNIGAIIRNARIANDCPYVPYVPMCLQIRIFRKTKCLFLIFRKN